MYAVDGVSIKVGEGETVGLVGESGCGKSTVGKTIFKIDRTHRGAESCCMGRRLLNSAAGRCGPFRRDMQIIFQDPYSSLNPRMSVGNIVGEPFSIHKLASGAEKEQRVAALFKRVGLRPEQMRSYPHEFFGRPTSAGRYCAGAGAQSKIDRGRRTGLRAGCIHPGSGDQFVDGPAGGNLDSPICLYPMIWPWWNTSAIAWR